MYFSCLPKVPLYVKSVLAYDGESKFSLVASPQRAVIEDSGQQRLPMVSPPPAEILGTNNSKTELHL